MSAPVKNKISEGCTALLLLLFVYTGSVKLMDFYAFRMVLQTSPLLKDIAGAVAIAIPTIELVLAILLLFRSTRLHGLKAATLLLVAFTVYVAYMLAFEPKLPCSCGGVISGMSWPLHLLFNILYTGISLLGWWSTADYEDLEHSDRTVQQASS